MKYYIDSSTPQMVSPLYDKGLREIKRTLEKTYTKVEHTYYKYILKPELEYYCANEK